MINPITNKPVVISQALCAELQVQYDAIQAQIERGGDGESIAKLEGQREIIDCLMDWVEK